MIGGIELAETQPSIVVEYKNERPIELLDLTASLAALGEQFKHFIAEHEAVDFAPRLYVHQIRPGSIIAELIPWLQQADFVLKHREELAGFVTHWREILEAILHLNNRAKSIQKPTLRSVRNFVAPIAKDNGAQLNIITQDNAAPTVNVLVINMRSEEAKMISHNAGHLLARGVPTEEAFDNEPLTLFQMRDARAGDMGFIDRFSEKPVKLTFASDETKNAILHHSDNPWDTIFFVSGVVKTAGGNVAAYHIRALDGVVPKDAT